MKTPTPSQRHSGFSLIEAMIALLIMSIGMLALAMLHIVALREQRNAHYRTSAIQLADDIADRIRIGRASIYSSSTALNGYLTSETTYASASALTQSSLALPTYAQGTAAAYDINIWRTSLIDRLGQGSTAGIILPIVGQPAGRQIVIVWTEKESKNVSSIVQPDPNCPTSIAAPNGTHCLSMIVAP